MQRTNLNNFNRKLNHNINHSVCHKYCAFIQYLFFKIFGLSPWKIDYLKAIISNRLENYKYNLCNTSLIGSFYNILVLLVLILFSTYSLLDDFFYQSYPGSTVLSSMIVKFLFVTSLCASLLPLVYIIRQKIIISVNNRFEIIDRVLNKCAYYESENNHTNDFIFVINFLTTIFGIIILDLLYYPALRVFFENLPTVISGGVIIQYAMTLNRVNKRFKSINLTFFKFGNFRCDATQPQKIFVTRKVVSCDFISNDIDNLKYAFIELCEMSQNISDFYGIPILISIICFAVRTIFSVYLIMLSLFKIQNIIIIWQVNGIRMAWIVFLFIVLTSSVTKIMKQV